MSLSNSLKYCGIRNLYVQLDSLFHFIDLDDLEIDSDKLTGTSVFEGILQLPNLRNLALSKNAPVR